MSDYSTNPFGAKIDWEFSDGSTSEIQDRAAESTKSAIATWDSSGIPKQLTGTQGDILYYGASGVVSKLTAGTAGRFLKTNGAGANPAWADGGGIVALGETILGSANATITVSGLTTTDYKYILLFFDSAGASGAGNVSFTLNGDNGANYDFRYNQSGTDTSATGQNVIRIAGGSSGFLQCSILVRNDAASRKFVMGYGGGAQSTQVIAGNWNNTTDKITSVSFTHGTGTFNTGSLVRVYGVL